MTEQPMERPECDHHWISYMQPSIGLSWIRQCSQCRDFDANNLGKPSSVPLKSGVKNLVYIELVTSGRTVTSSIL